MLMTRPCIFFTSFFLSISYVCCEEKTNRKQECINQRKEMDLFNHSTVLHIHSIIGRGGGGGCGRLVRRWEKLKLALQTYYHNVLVTFVY